MTSVHPRRLAPVLLVLSLVACREKSDATTAPDASPPPAPPPSAPVNATPLPAASIAQVVNPQGLPPYAGPTGSVEGTILVEGPPSPDAPAASYAECPDGQRIYGKAFREGAPRPDGKRPLADAVVVVTGYANAYIPEQREAALVKIEGCALDQRAVAMTFGQRLDVKNDSAQFWAPVLEQAPTPALMIAAPRTTDPVRLYPPKPGWYSLVDRMKHGYARADVYVVLQPLHTVSDLAGHYRIDGAPVGKLKVSAHSAAVGDASADVDVLAGVVQKVDLVLRYAPKAAVDASAPAATTADAGRPRELLK